MPRKKEPNLPVPAPVTPPPAEGAAAVEVVPVLPREGQLPLSALKQARVWAVWSGPQGKFIAPDGSPSTPSNLTDYATASEAMSWMVGDRYRPCRGPGGSDSCPKGKPTERSSTTTGRPSPSANRPHRPCRGPGGTDGSTGAGRRSAKRRRRRSWLATAPTAPAVGRVVQTEARALAEGLRSGDGGVYGGAVVGERWRGAIGWVSNVDNAHVRRSCVTSIFIRRVG